MTVADLIALLKEFPGDATVVIDHPVWDGFGRVDDVAYATWARHGEVAIFLAEDDRPWPDSGCCCDR